MAVPGDVVPVGDAAVMVMLGETADEVVMSRVWSLCAALRDALGESVTDVVPAFASVVVRFDPRVARLATIMACARGVLESSGAVLEVRSRLVDVNVCFDPQFALDLPEVARHAKVAESEAVAEFCKPLYRVAFLGFAPGFPYLIGLPKVFALPRLPTPRVRVPAGSVALAAGICGIYPRPSPGGWRILGKTNADLFDLARVPAALFAPGDRVRFHPVGSLAQATATAAP